MIQKEYQTPSISFVVMSEMDIVRTSLVYDDDTANFPPSWVE